MSCIWREALLLPRAHMQGRGAHRIQSYIVTSKMARSHPFHPKISSKIIFRERERERGSGSGYGSGDGDEDNGGGERVVAEGVPDAVDQQPRGLRLDPPEARPGEPHLLPHPPPPCPSPRRRWSFPSSHSSFIILLVACFYSFGVCYICVDIYFDHSIDYCCCWIGVVFMCWGYLVAI